MRQTHINDSSGILQPDNVEMTGFVFLHSVMTNKPDTPPVQWHKPIVTVLLGCIIFFACSLNYDILAQGKPPKQFDIYNIRGLNFGSFYPGTGGTITIQPVITGTPATTGGIILVGSGQHSALIEIVTQPNTLVNFNFPTTPIILNRVEGGEMTLSVGPSNWVGNSFNSLPGANTRNPIYIGGTLTVGNISSNPAGSYIGHFDIIFNYQ